MMMILMKNIMNFLMMKKKKRKKKKMSLVEVGGEVGEIEEIGGQKDKKEENKKEI